MCVCVYVCFGHSGNKGVFVRVTRRARAEVGGTTTEVGGVRSEMGGAILGHAPLPIAATLWPR